ncbi:hypothetical protein [Nonomuraea sp. NPDC052265]|uniref:hypothetical protein n=1 Tax=Nonomuraea sp. NPDC052265 TaxID=3364374 RepID=UPI0037C64610
MGGTVVVGTSTLRRAAGLAAVLVVATLVVAAVVVMSPSEDERLSAASPSMEAVALTVAEGADLGDRTVGGLTFERVHRGLRPPRLVGARLKGSLWRSRVPVSRARRPAVGAP